MKIQKKILLVDDDADDQLFFVDAIKEIEPAIDCGLANNGLEALEYLEKIPPPPYLIFLDLNMPLMNGFECLEELKKTEAYKKIPVIIFTTSSQPKDIEKTMLLGAKMYLTKPADFNSLKDKLIDILKTNFEM